MTPDQFRALATMLKLRTGPAQTLCRLVLVDGMAVPEATKATGMTRQAAHQAIKRARKGMELAKIAATDPAYDQNRAT